MDENEKSWLNYLAEMGDVGWGVPGAGEGLEELYNFIGGPSEEDLSDLASSYEGMDYKYPKMAYDTTAFGINTLKDIFQFPLDMGIDALQTGWARTPTWMGGGGQDLLSTDAKLRKDAWLHDKLGRFSWYDAESNPYTNPELIGGYYKDASDAAAKHFFTHEDKGGFMNEKKAGEIWDVVEEKLPWSKWIRENPNADPEEFRKLEDQLFMAEFDKRYGDKWNEFVETDVDRSLMEYHGIGADKGAISNFEFGIGDSDLGGYASLGQPLLPYFTPEKDVLYDAHKITEIAGGPGIVKGGLKAGRKLFPKQSLRSEGIMDNVRRLEGPGKSRYDWAEEWLRDRGAL